MHDAVAFVAAPYGFGPSSKAISISSHLPPSVSRVFFSDGPALDLAACSGAFHHCRQLSFSSSTAMAPVKLTDFRVIVFVNSTRFITAPPNNEQTIVFVDTLAWLRKSIPTFANSVDAFFAQRFFGQQFLEELSSTSSFHSVGAIVSKSISTASRERGNKNLKDQRTPLVHCGGLFSPAMVKGADISFVQNLLEFLKATSIDCRVILPRYLIEQFACHGLEKITLTECSTNTVHNHIAGTSYVLTTSGIEFTYEAMIIGAPVIFLPPFNATQYLQLRHHKAVTPSAVSFDLNYGSADIDPLSLDHATKRLQFDGMNGRWESQFQAIAQYLGCRSQALSPNHLLNLRRVQSESVRKVGWDGAETIAAYIVDQFCNGRASS